jgi:hypothetical protein
MLVSLLETSAPFTEFPKTRPALADDVLNFATDGPNIMQGTIDGAADIALIVGGKVTNS